MFFAELFFGKSSTRDLITRLYDPHDSFQLIMSKLTFQCIKALNCNLKEFRAIGRLSLLTKHLPLQPRLL